jgi:hypothetical protein
MNVVSFHELPRLFVHLPKSLAQESEQAAIKIAEHQINPKTPFCNAVSRVSNPMRTEDECK